MAKLWIAKKDELDGYSTVFSSSQKQQLQDFLKKEYKFEKETKNRKDINNDKIESAQEAYANIAKGLRQTRSELYKYIEIGYVKYNDLKRDIHGDKEEHVKYLDEMLSLMISEYIQEFSYYSSDIKYVWFDRCSKKGFNKKQKEEYLAEQNENKRIEELTKYKEQGFDQTLELLELLEDNNFFIQTIIGYYEQIHKYIFKTRPFLYPTYNYLNHIPYDEISEDNWIRGVKGEGNEFVWLNDILIDAEKKEDEVEEKREAREWKALELYTSILPSELEQDLLKKINSVIKQSKESLSAGEQNLIINADYQTLHENIPDNSIDIVLTDPPYFIGYAGNSWDKSKKETKRFEYFEAYFKSLIPKLKEEAVLLIFNDYSNIDIIEKSLLTAYAENYYESIDDGNLEGSKEEWIDSLIKNGPFTILPYLEWAKTNPRPHVHVNKLSEYVITAVKGYKQFENMFDVYDYVSYQNAKKDPEFIQKLDEDSLEYETLMDNLEYENMEIIDSSFDEDPEIYNSLSSPDAYQVEDVIHDTPKPAPMLNKLLKRFSKPGMTVLDSFSGSGAISISAYEFGLQSIACELDDYMTLVSKNRFADFSRLVGRKIINLVTKNSKSILPNYYSYELFKEDVINYFYTPVYRIETKEERAIFLEKRLLEIRKKAKSKTGLNLVDKKLAYEDHCFLIGFNEIYNTKEFHTIFGESGRNKKMFFGNSEEKRHSVNLACRYFNRFKQTLFAGDYITYLYDCSFAFKNWKNLDKAERSIRLEKYTRYLHHLINDLLLIDSDILNRVEEVRTVSMDDSSYKSVYHYYYTLTLAVKYYYRLVVELEEAEKKGFISDKKFKEYRFTSDEIESSSPLISIKNMTEFKKYKKDLYKNYDYQRSNSDIKIKPSLDAIEYYLKNIKTKHTNEEQLNSVYVAKNIGLTKGGLLDRKKIKNDGSFGGTGKNLISLQPYMYTKKNDRKKLIKEIEKDKLKIYEEHEIKFR